MGRGILTNAEGKGSWTYTGKEGRGTGQRAKGKGTEPVSRLGQSLRRFRQALRDNTLWLPLCGVHRLSSFS